MQFTVMSFKKLESSSNADESLDQIGDDVDSSISEYIHELW